ncbi:hypothetical protein JB92DRAFT_3136713 [Gautieria morchelliformis]|nr:hypothetical protein JB92DRAFT_3136713 [Gautieria morchelliformis]
MGVELINWPGDIPFRSVSDIGLFHQLRCLQAVLALEDPDQRSKWVKLSNTGWEKRKATYQQEEAKAIPKKCKRKPQVVTDSNSNADSHLELDTSSSDEAQEVGDSGSGSKEQGGSGNGSEGQGAAAGPLPFAATATAPLPFAAAAAAAKGKDKVAAAVKGTAA